VDFMIVVVRRVWGGFGILLAVYAPLVLWGVYELVETHLGQGYFWSRAWPVIAAFTAAAAVNWALERAWFRDFSDQIDHVWGIPLRWWTGILPVIGVAIAIFDPLGLQDRDPPSDRTVRPRSSERRSTPTGPPDGAFCSEGRVLYPTDPTPAQIEFCKRR